MKEAFDRLYLRYDDRRFVDPDPLALLYRFTDVRDREVAAMVASSLAFGNVRQIMGSVEDALSRMGGSPFEYVSKATASRIARDMKGFQHRWARADDMQSLLAGIGRVVRKYKSLENCFMAGLGSGDEDVIDALAFFVSELSGKKSCDNNCLLPLPGRGSACKRLNLYLKWMVRRDRVDPGGWDMVPASKLVVPLDVHMMRFGTLLGFTKRKQADIAAAREITGEFRKMDPDDPVKYDFALTRLAIRSDTDRDELLDMLGLEAGGGQGGKRAGRKISRRARAASRVSVTASRGERGEGA